MCSHWSTQAWWHAVNMTVHVCALRLHLLLLCVFHPGKGRKLFLPDIVTLQESSHGNVDMSQ